MVDRVHVERGERVAAGQPLIGLRSAVEAATANVAELRAKIDADIRAAQASVELARQKMQRARTLVAEDFVSTQAVEQASAEHEVAVQKLAQARGQQQVWEAERRVAEAQLALRTVRSPFAGVVVERYVTAGERVEDKPLLRVAVVHPLRVELMVSTQHYGALHAGDSITVRPELPGARPVVAKVMHIDKVMDAASNSFRVRLTLPNPNDELPAGLRCKAELPLAAGAAAASAPSAQPAPGAGASAAAVLPLAAARRAPGSL